MARNGSGVYSLPAGNPVTTGTTISSTWANTTLSDIGSALTTSISIDGQTLPTANLPMGNYAHTNVGNATVRTQYASAGQVQDGALEYLGSVSGTDTITASAAVGMSAYTVGQTFRFVAAGANTTTAVTININGIGAKNITKNGTTALAVGDISSGSAVQIVYDGTQFQATNIAKPTVSSVSGILPEANGGTGTTTGYYGFKNRIINGTGRIQQRGVGTATNGGYGPDRWQLALNGTGITAALSSAAGASDPSGWHFYIQSQTAKASLASADFIFCFQPIEGFNVADLQWGTASAKTITVSFIAYASVAGSYSVFIRNASANRSYCSLVNMTVGNASYSVTIPGDTTGTWAIDNTTGLQIGFTLAGGSAVTTTGNAWTAGNFVAATGQANGAAVLNQYINLTNVQLEVGSTATSFDYRPYGTELALCQRYYYRVPVGSSTQSPSGLVNSTSTFIGFNPFPVTMRIAPTALEQSGTATDYPVTAGSTSLNGTSVPTYNSGTTVFCGKSVFTTAASLTVGQSGYVGNTANSYLGWSAEL